MWRGPRVKGAHGFKAHVFQILELGAFSLHLTVRMTAASDTNEEEKEKASSIKSNSNFLNKDPYSVYLIISVTMIH